MIDVQKGGTLVLESGILTGHTCTTEGGAIYNAGTVEIKGGTISGNTATMGGAIFLEEGSTTVISGGVITDNTATYRGGALGTAERNLGDESLFPVVEISGGEITGNKTMEKGASFNFHTVKVTVSGGKIGWGQMWDSAKSAFVGATGAGGGWLRGSIITLSGGTLEEAAVRPENGGHNTYLTITGKPVVDSLATLLTVGDSTTVSSVEKLIGGAYVKSSAQLTVAEGDTSVKASGTYIYEASVSVPSGEPVMPITNVVMQPGSDITQRNFTWFSQSGETGYITYAKTEQMYNGGFPANAVKVAATRDGDKSLRPGFYNNKVTVSGLEPGAEYSYQLSNGSDKSDVFTFRVGEKTDEFSFLFIGDPQLGQPSSPLFRQKEGWDRTLNQLTTDPIFADVDLWVGAGDQVTANADHDTHANMYDAFLNNEWMPSVLYSSAVGNHDNGSKGDHFQHFNETGYMINPATGQYYGQTWTAGDSNIVGADYWYTYNSVLFVVLNVNDMSWGSTAQAHAGYRGPENQKLAQYHLEFIDKVLELNRDNEDIKWKIVVYHESPYGASYHNNFTQDSTGEYSIRPEQYMFIDMRQYLLPGIDERGFDVVLSGHDHVYTRTHVMDHSANSTNGLYYGNESVSALENTAEDGANYYTYADGITSPTFVRWTDLNGAVHTDTKLASVPVKVTAPTGVLHITASSSSGSSRNADDYIHPYAVVTVGGKTVDRQVVLVDVTDNTLTFTNYALGSTAEDYVLSENVLDTFTIEKTPGTDEPAQSKTFADVEGHWAWKAVDYVVANGIMSGYNADTFGPDDTLNRAMVVQVLYNKEGQLALNGAAHDFKDVPATQWFNNAVTWGSANKVVSGWAADALRWAVEKGLLEGVPFTNATEKATRGQTAQMLMNYLNAN